MFCFGRLEITTRLPQFLSRRDFECSVNLVGITPFLLEAPLYPAPCRSYGYRLTNRSSALDSDKSSFPAAHDHDFFRLIEISKVRLPASYVARMEMFKSARFGY
jgi:hypothetical protein